MITMQNNPMVCSPSQPYGILLSQTRETLLDSEIYLRFIRSAERAFRSVAKQPCSNHSCSSWNLWIQKIISAI